jgi:hypothetical protein
VSPHFSNDVVDVKPGAPIAIAGVNIGRVMNQVQHIHSALRENIIAESRICLVEATLNELRAPRGDPVISDSSTVEWGARA